MQFAALRTVAHEFQHLPVGDQTSSVVFIAISALFPRVRVRNRLAVRRDIRKTLD